MTVPQLRALIDRAGGVEAFARTFSYRTRPTKATLYNWLAGKPMPREAVKAIERLSRKHTPDALGER